MSDIVERLLSAEQRLREVGEEKHTNPTALKLQQMAKDIADSFSEAAAGGPVMDEQERINWIHAKTRDRVVEVRMLLDSVKFYIFDYGISDVLEQELRGLQKDTMLLLELGKEAGNRAA